MANGTLLEGSTISQAAPPRHDGLRLLGALRANAGAMKGTLVLIAVFVLSLSPYAVSPVLFYPDEPQYADAGLFMCQSGDWLMPRNSSDAPPRDIKPIFTYWVVALSYKIFGTSLAAARLPYLLAAAAVVWLTYRLALMVTDGSRSAAALACVVLLCNPLFWLSAIRCIPDIWLCLFLLISAYGFIGLFALEAPTSKHALLAYVGVGLAILAKGVPALLFLGVAILFGACICWRRRSWRRLIDVPSMALGTVVAVSWFVIVFFTHGTESLKLLWSDQVGTRVQGNPWVVTYRFPLALGALAFAYLPLYWPMCKMGGRWRDVLPAAGRERVACAFILLWAVVNVLAMTGTHDWYLRYLLPAFPLLAVLFGVTLAKIDGEILRHCFRRLLVCSLAFLAIAAVLGIIIAAQLQMSALEIAPGIALIGVTLLAAAVGWHGSWLRSAQALALSLLLLMPASFTSLRKIARPDLEEQIEQRLRLEHLDTHKVAAFVGQKGPATNLRLALGPGVKLLQWETLSDAATGARPLDETLPDLLILPEQSAALLPARKYTILAAGSAFDSPKDEEWFHAICEGRLGACLLQHRLRYCIAVRVQNTQTASHLGR
jgi:4-amino-4-deoxy-L-arabinose transferase-like glycosyltransferase